MNGKRLVLSVLSLAGLLIAVPVSAYDEQDQRITERTVYTERAPEHGTWIAEHNYRHRLRVEQEYRRDVPRHHHGQSRHAEND
jgi:hypothetical protein